MGRYGPYPRANRRRSSGDRDIRGDRLMKSKDEGDGNQAARRSGLSVAAPDTAPGARLHFGARDPDTRGGREHRVAGRGRRTRAFGPAGRLARRIPRAPTSDLGGPLPAGSGSRPEHPPLCAVFGRVMSAPMPRVTATQTAAGPNLSVRHANGGARFAPRRTDPRVGRANSLQPTSDSPMNGAFAPCELVLMDGPCSRLPDEVHGARAAGWPCFGNLDRPLAELVQVRPRHLLGFPRRRCPTSRPRDNRNNARTLRAPGIERTP